MLWGTHLDLCGASQEAGEIIVRVIALLTSLHSTFTLICHTHLVDNNLLFRTWLPALLLMLLH